MCYVSGVVDTNAYIIGENPNKDVDLQVENKFVLTFFANQTKERIDQQDGYKIFVSDNDNEYYISKRNSKKGSFGIKHFP